MLVICLILDLTNTHQPNFEFFLFKINAVVRLDDKQYVKLWGSARRKFKLSIIKTSEFQQKETILVGKLRCGGISKVHYRKNIFDIEDLLYLFLN